MIQEQFINRLLDLQDPLLLVDNNITEEYFSSNKEQYRFIKEHIEKTAKLPDKATFLASFPDFPCIVVTEPDDYLIKELRNDRDLHLMASLFNDIRAKSLQGHVEDAKALFLKGAEKLTESVASGIKTIDLLQDTSRYDAYVERCSSFDKYYVKTGFNELDEIIGGWDRTEELATIAARTNQGKSWILIKSAVAAVKQGLRVGIYSGEMSDRKVGYRFDTLLGHISNSGLVRGKSEYMSEYELYLEGLKNKFPDSCMKVLTPSMIGGPAGVLALRSFIEKEKLDILFIDQHSLLDDDRKARNPVEKASNISKDLKNLQVLKQIPIISVSQQNRTSTEGGVGTEHIAQSDRIAQDSTIIIFFEQDKESKLLTMQLVKSRDSANAVKLQYHFNFDKGTFDFVPEDGEYSPDIPSNDTLSLKNSFDDEATIIGGSNDIF